MDRLTAPSHLLRYPAAVAGTLILLGSSQAGELNPRPAADRCAMYGPGFAAVAGSDTCLRIGGRIRVEAGNGAFAPNTGWANGVEPVGTSPTSDAQRHLRLSESRGAVVDPFAR